MLVNEADWKLFRKKLPDWQEAHMEKLLKEDAAVIAGSERASDKFWELEERINADKKHVGVVARMSRSKMYNNLFSLLSEGAITLQDLEDFSEDLQEEFALVMRDQ